MELHKIILFVFIWAGISSDAVAACCGAGPPDLLPDVSFRWYYFEDNNVVGNRTVIAKPALVTYGFVIDSNGQAYRFVKHPSRWGFNSLNQCTGNVFYTEKSGVNKKFYCIKKADKKPKADIRIPIIPTPIDGNVSVFLGEGLLLEKNWQALNEDLAMEIRNKGCENQLLVKMLINKGAEFEKTYPYKVLTPECLSVLPDYFIKNPDMLRRNISDHRWLNAKEHDVVVSKYLSKVTPFIGDGWIYQYRLLLKSLHKKMILTNNVLLKYINNTDKN